MKTRLALRPPLLLFARLLLVCVCSVSVLAQRTIRTVVGGDWVFDGDNKLAAQAPLGQVSGLARDTAGNIYVFDTGNHMVFKITTDGVLHAFAGNYTLGFGGDGG